MPAADQMIILSAGHLRRIVSRYVVYYNRVRTHLSLSKDVPERRAAQPADQGVVKEFGHVGGLQHEYVRMAA